MKTCFAVLNGRGKIERENTEQPIIIMIVQAQEFGLWLASFFHHQHHHQQHHHGCRSWFGLLLVSSVALWMCLWVWNHKRTDYDFAAIHFAHTERTSFTKSIWQKYHSHYWGYNFWMEFFFCLIIWMLRNVWATKRKIVQNVRVRQVSAFTWMEYFYLCLCMCRAHFDQHALLSLLRKNWDNVRTIWCDTLVWCCHVSIFWSCVLSLHLMMWNSMKFCFRWRRWRRHKNAFLRTGLVIWCSKMCQ